MMGDRTAHLIVPTPCPPLRRPCEKGAKKQLIIFCAKLIVSSAVRKNNDCYLCEICDNNKRCDFTVIYPPHPAKDTLAVTTITDYNYS